MKLINNKNYGKTLWSIDSEYYICSTSLDNSEVMVFQSDSNGNIVDYMDLYVSYTQVDNHAYHMEQFRSQRGS